MLVFFYLLFLLHKTPFSMSKRLMLKPSPSLPNPHCTSVFHFIQCSSHNRHILSFYTLLKSYDNSHHNPRILSYLNNIITKLTDSNHFGLENKPGSRCDLHAHTTAFTKKASKAKRLCLRSLLRILFFQISKHSS